MHGGVADGRTSEVEFSEVWEIGCGGEACACEVRVGKFEVSESMGQGEAFQALFGDSISGEAKVLKVGKLDNAFESFIGDGCVRRVEIDEVWEKREGFACHFRLWTVDFQDCKLCQRCEFGEAVVGDFASHRKHLQLGVRGDAFHFMVIEALRAYGQTTELTELPDGAEELRGIVGGGVNRVDSVTEVGPFAANDGGPPGLIGAPCGLSVGQEIGDLAVGVPLQVVPGDVRGERDKQDDDEQGEAEGEAHDARSGRASAEGGLVGGIEGAAAFGAGGGGCAEVVAAGFAEGGEGWGHGGYCMGGRANA